VLLVQIIEEIEIEKLIQGSPEEYVGSSACNQVKKKLHVIRDIMSQPMASCSFCLEPWPFNTLVFKIRDRTNFYESIKPIIHENPVNPRSCYRSP
jgi:hypothetical protein